MMTLSKANFQLQIGDITNLKSKVIYERVVNQIYKFCKCMQIREELTLVLKLPTISER